MKERTKEWLALISIIGLFIFVGFAVMLNIDDRLTGSNSAYWINIIGWCLVPIMFVVGLVIYKKAINHTKVGEAEE